MEASRLHLKEMVKNAEEIASTKAIERYRAWRESEDSRVVNAPIEVTLGCGDIDA